MKKSLLYSSSRYSSRQPTNPFELEKPLSPAPPRSSKHQKALPYEEYEDDAQEVSNEDAPDLYETHPLEFDDNFKPPRNSQGVGSSSAQEVADEADKYPSLDDVMNQDLTSRAPPVEVEESDEIDPGSLTEEARPSDNPVVDEVGEGQAEEEEVYTLEDFRENELQHLQHLHALIAVDGFLAVPETPDLILHKAFLYLHHIALYLGRPFPTIEQGQEFFQSLLHSPTHPLSDLTFARSSILQLAFGAASMFKAALSYSDRASVKYDPQLDPFAAHLEDVMDGADKMLLDQWQSTGKLPPSISGTLELTPGQQVERKRVLEHALRSRQMQLDALHEGAKAFIRGKDHMESMMESFEYLATAHRVLKPHLYPTELSDQPQFSSESEKKAYLEPFEQRLEETTELWASTSESLTQLCFELAEGLEQCGWGVNAFETVEDAEDASTSQESIEKDSTHKPENGQAR